MINTLSIRRSLSCEFLVLFGDSQRERERERERIERERERERETQRERERVPAVTGLDGWTERRHAPRLAAG